MALVAVQNFQPDLILLDIRMPEMDGYAVCEHLKANGQTAEIPIIFLSALDDAIDKVKAFEVGAADYITKPFQVQEVLARVRHQLTIQQLQQQLQVQNQLLSQAKEAAEAASQAKGAFLSRMSHELRTPLNAILGYADLLNKDMALAADHRESVGIIQESGRHLLSLVNDVLDMARIEAGRVVINPVAVDIQAFLQGLEQMFQLQAAAKGLLLKVACDRSVAPYVTVDRNKLLQVLINLLGNAIKFTIEGEVDLQVWQTEDPGCAPIRLHFQVQDTGAGIDSAELDGLFEAFAQTERGQRSPQGTGLGLAISQKFVELMGGDIALTSQLGVGTQITFDIPVEPSTLEDLETHNEGALCQPQRFVLAPGQPRYRLLVVEDKWVNRNLLVQILKSAGFEVRAAENGQQALTLWQDWHPHLIWMDMQMPVMDGYEAAKTIKTHLQGQATVLIALTASAWEKHWPVSLDGYCDDFARKPFRDQEIFDKLSQHLGVVFVSAENELRSPPGSAPIPSSGLDFSQLPQPWREQFYQATLQLHPALMLQLIGQIKVEHPDLAQSLTHLTQQFQYERILAILSSARP